MRLFNPQILDSVCHLMAIYKKKKKDLNLIVEISRIGPQTALNKMA
jgi:hypothetical protein